MIAKLWRINDDPNQRYQGAFVFCYVVSTPTLCLNNLCHLFLVTTNQSDALFGNTKEVECIY